MKRENKANYTWRDPFGKTKCGNGFLYPQMEGKTRGGDESRKYVSYVYGGEEKKRKGKGRKKWQRRKFNGLIRLDSKVLASFPFPSLLLPSSPSHHVASTLARNSKSWNIPFRREKFQLVGKEGSVAGSSRGPDLENDIINEPIESI